MNDYRKSDFYHYFDNKSNTRRYFIRVYGSFIEVNKDVYYTCYNSYRKQLRDNRRIDVRSNAHSKYREFTKCTAGEQIQ
mgnify:CR=1 FL=1